MLEKNGKICIGRRQSNVEENYMYIEIFEENRESIAKVKISLKDFTLALTGVAFVPCEVDARRRQYY